MEAKHFLLRACLIAVLFAKSFAAKGDSLISLRCIDIPRSNDEIKTPARVRFDRARSSALLHATSVKNVLDRQGKRRVA
jgi:hypothetical protein